jgi:drug/metabolite transporter (DMT)-like permease
MAAILVSTALQGFSLVVVKKFGQPINPGIITLSGMAIGAVLLLTLAAAFEPVASVTWNVTAVGSILYLAFIGSVLTFVSYYWLLKRIDPVYLSLTTFVNPIVAVILGALILGEKLEPAIFAGATLVLGGILVANGKSLYAKITSGA